jgi:hypothetical protein
MGEGQEQEEEPENKPNPVRYTEAALVETRLLLVV